MEAKEALGPGDVFLAQDLMPQSKASSSHASVNETFLQIAQGSDEAPKSAADSVPGPAPLPVPGLDIQDAQVSVELKFHKGPANELNVNGFVEILEYKLGKLADSRGNVEEYNPNFEEIVPILNTISAQNNQKTQNMIQASSSSSDSVMFTNGAAQNSRALISTSTDSRDYVMHDEIMMTSQQCLQGFEYVRDRLSLLGLGEIVLKVPEQFKQDPSNVEFSPYFCYADYPAPSWSMELHPLALTPAGLYKNREGVKGLGLGLIFVSPVGDRINGYLRNTDHCMMAYLARNKINVQMNKSCNLQLQHLHEKRYCVCHSSSKSVSRSGANAMVKCELGTFCGGFFHKSCVRMPKFKPRGRAGPPKNPNPVTYMCPLCVMFLDGAHGYGKHNKNSGEVNLHLLREVSVDPKYIRPVHARITTVHTTAPMNKMNYPIGETAVPHRIYGISSSNYSYQATFLEWEKDKRNQNQNPDQKHNNNQRDNYSFPHTHTHTQTQTQSGTGTGRVAGRSRGGGIRRVANGGSSRGGSEQATVAPIESNSHRLLAGLAGLVSKIDTDSDRVVEVSEDSPAKVYPRGYYPGELSSDEEGDKEEGGSSSSALLAEQLKKEESAIPTVDLEKCSSTFTRWATFGTIDTALIPVSGIKKKSLFHDGRAVTVRVDGGWMAQSAAREFRQKAVAVGTNYDNQTSAKQRRSKAAVEKKKKDERTKLEKLESTRQRVIQMVSTRIGQGVIDPFKRKLWEAGLGRAKTVVQIRYV